MYDYKSIMGEDESLDISEDDDDPPKMTPLMVKNHNRKMSNDSMSDDDSDDDVMELYKQKILTYPIIGDANSRRPKLRQAGIPVGSNKVSYLLGFGKHEIQIALMFMRMINIERGEVEWSNNIIGATLKNIMGEEAGFNTWIQLNPQNTRQKYHTLLMPSRTIRTLAWFAQLDSPQQYYTWHSHWCSDAVYNIIMEAGSMLSIGILLARFVWLEYKSVEIGPRRVGYFYRKHGWKMEHQSDHLNMLLITSLKDYLSGYLTYVKLGTKDAGTDNVMKIIDTVIKKHIGDKHIRIAQEALSLLRDSDFTFNKSNNMTKLRMKNCVIETTTNGIYVRDGTPEDCLVLSTNIDYPFDMTMDSPEVKARERWCFETFGSDSLSHAMSVDMASFARGGNNEKIFRAWVGPLGNNSKSMHLECLSEAYGQYMKTLPVSALSGATAGQGAANAEMARTEGAFLVAAKEPEANEYIHGGRVKGVTGGVDHIYVRSLYEDGREMKITWKLLVMSNHDMPIGQGGKALDNRMMITPFESTYVDDAPESYEDQKKMRRFKMDKDFGDNLHDMARAYWFLTVNKYYDCYVNNTRKGVYGSKMHPTISRRTLQYNRTNNLVLFFWDEVIQEHKPNNNDYDMSVSLTIANAFSRFVEFCASKSVSKNQMIGMDLFSTDFYSETMRKCIPTDNEENHTKKRYYGITLK